MIVIVSRVKFLPYIVALIVGWALRFVFFKEKK